VGGAQLQNPTPFLKHHISDCA